MIHTPITVNSIGGMHNSFTETGGNDQIQNQLITPATADRHWALPTIDAEVGTQLLLPSEAEVMDGNQVEHRGDLPSGRLFETIRPGIARVACPGTAWAVFVRVSRRQYIGLAQYRHLEDDEPDDGAEDEGGVTDDE